VKDVWVVGTSDAAYCSVILLTYVIVIQWQWLYCVVANLSVNAYTSQLSLPSFRGRYMSSKLQSDVRCGSAMRWMFMGWRPGVVDWGGGVFASCCRGSNCMLGQGQLSLPSLRGGYMSTSFGRECKDVVYSVSGWTRGVQVKLWDPLRTRVIPERLRGVFTTRCYTNPRLPLPLPCLWTLFIIIWQPMAGL